MEISDLSSAVVSRRAATALTERPPVSRADPSPRFVDDSKGSVLDAFRQEIRTTLSSRFFSRFAADARGYADSSASVSDVSKDALRAARQVAAEAPTRASERLVSLRASINESASAIREQLINRGDVAGVNDALGRIDRGLDALDSQYANVRESSASVLSVNSRVTERSTISIRTQEGDIVRLDLKNRELFSATGAEASVDGNTASVTEFEFGSRTRLRFTVEGDLNDDELAAIGLVVEQASRIADEFFGGDIAAAAASAGGLDIDNEQLERVNLRFLYRESTSVRFASQVEQPVTQPVGGPDRVATTGPGDPVPTLVIPAVPAEPVAPTRPAGPIPTLVIPTVPVVPVTPAPSVVAPPISDVQPTDDAPTVDLPASAVGTGNNEATVEPKATASPLATRTEALDEFLELISDFLRSVSEGFVGSEDDGAVRFQFSESFKLTLLRETLSVTAPVEQPEIAEAAGDVVDAVAQATADAADNEENT
ncbi:MAG: hypothetical protein AAFX44_10045 [Pseudomonadota bacterium]